MATLRRCCTSNGGWRIVGVLSIWYRVFFTSAPQYGDHPQSILRSLHADLSMRIHLAKRSAIYSSRPMLPMDGGSSEEKDDPRSTRRGPISSFAVTRSQASHPRSVKDTTAGGGTRTLNEWRAYLKCDPTSSNASVVSFVLKKIVRSLARNHNPFTFNRHIAHYPQ